jgi:uncharacterized membrane protein YbhN (UPF0104 family)
VSLNKIVTGRQLVFLLFSLIVSAVVFFYLFSSVSWSDVYSIIRNISMPMVVLYVMFSFSMSFFRTWRYSLLLHVSGYRTDTIVLFLVTLVRNFFSDLLPARLGTLIYVYLARSRMGISWSSATASFAYSFVFDILSLGVLIIGAALAVSFRAMNPWALIGGGGLLVVSSYLLLFLLPWLLATATRLIPDVFFLKKRWRSSVAQWIMAVRSELLLLQKSGLLFRVLLLSFGVRCSKYLSLYILLLALVIPYGYSYSDFPLLKVFFGICSAELAASLPISGLAGFGAYEGVWSLVFQLLGYPEKIAILTSVSHHLLTQVYGYSLGAVALLLLLTPLRQRDSTSHIRAITLKSWKFYSAFVVLFVFPPAVSVLFVANGVLQPSDSHSLQSVIVPQNDTPRSPPPGWVVFQRPDGIYRIKIGAAAAQKLTAGGICPRWSVDGKQIAFVDGRRIMVMAADGRKQRQIAETESGKAVCFHPSGKAVLFTDIGSIRQVEIDTGKTVTLWQGKEFLELDISDDGRILVATEKKFPGYRVIAVELTTGIQKVVGNGCSASISSGELFISVNGRDHRTLALHNWSRKEDIRELKMVKGLGFDNQFWSNDRDWIASKSDEDAANIYVHHLPSQGAYQITFEGKNDRPDYFIDP